jgi:hypothetical protein
MIWQRALHSAVKRARPKARQSDSVIDQLAERVERIQRRLELREQP